MKIVTSFMVYYSLYMQSTVLYWALYPLLHYGLLSFVCAEYSILLGFLPITHLWSMFRTRSASYGNHGQVGSGRGLIPQKGPESHVFQRSIYLCY